MIETVVFAASLVLAIGLAFLIQGPPYVPSDDESAGQMLKIIKSYSPKRILDMGSGNGKLVILLAKQGYKVDGVELNPLLVWRSRRAVKRAGLSAQASIKWGNFWAFDVAKYDLITLYAIKHVMPRLEQKLSAELRPGARIVSNYFVFPALKPVKRLSRAQAYEIRET